MLPLRILLRIRLMMMSTRTKEKVPQMIRVEKVLPAYVTSIPAFFVKTFQEFYNKILYLDYGKDGGNDV